MSYVSIQCDQAGGVVPSSLNTAAVENAAQPVPLQPAIESEAVSEGPEVMVSQALALIASAIADNPKHPESDIHEVISCCGQSVMAQGVSYAKALDLFLKSNQAHGYALNVGALTSIVKTVYGYETKSPLKLVVEMNKIHAVVNLGGKCRVMKQTTDPDTGLSDFVFSSQADFKAFYAHRKVEMSGSNITLGNLWFNSSIRREYEGLTFNPRTTPQGYFNLWTGFSIEPRDGDCSLFLAHVRDVIAQGNSIIYEYIVAWMADCVQNPDVLQGVALVLRGAMGTGKGVFANAFGSLFGRHFMPLIQGSQLTGRFNDHMKDKVLLFADESFWAGDKQAEGVLKALITEPYIVIEGKGENAFKIRNHLHFIFATNNDWCVPAGAQERRFFVLDVSEARMQDHEYFNAINNQLENGGRSALLHYLQNYDLRGKNLRKFPQTSALLEQKVYSMTLIQKFWYSRLDSGILAASGTGWDTEIPTKMLYSDFIRYCSNMGIRHRPSDSEFGYQLKKIVPELRNGKGRTGRYGSIRPNVYKVPSLAQCRRAFDKLINYEVTWPVYETTETDTSATSGDVAEVSEQ